jgi:hypothetical protein
MRKGQFMHEIKICNDKNFQIVIPENTTIETVDVSDYINPNGHNFTEYQKLCCIVDLLRSHESYLELFRKFRDSLIKAIKEERNSDLIWENDVKRVYIDDNDYICDILEIYENDNEDVIVSKFKEILFDPNYYITYHKYDDDYDETDDYDEWDF